MSLFLGFQIYVLTPYGHHGTPMVPHMPHLVAQQHHLGSQMADIVTWVADGDALPLLVISGGSAEIQTLIFESKKRISKK